MKAIVIESAFYELFSETVFVGSFENEEEGLLLIAVFFFICVEGVFKTTDGVTGVVCILGDDILDVFSLGLGSGFYFA